MGCPSRLNARELTFKQLAPRWHAHKHFQENIDKTNNETNKNAENLLRDSLIKLSRVYFEAKALRPSTLSMK